MLNQYRPIEMENKETVEVISRERLRGKPFAPERPHVVILGAGASIASLLNGDRNGKKVLGMNDLPEILGDHWKKLQEAAAPPEGDFESQFSWIPNSGKFESDLAEIERKIKGYFSGLQLPDAATIYDYLVLGLRGKDLIATFNWDPFLMQAYRRNTGIAELPDVRFLHGSVAFATCREHDVIGVPGEICPACGQQLERSGLFYPDADKDYSGDAIISRDWDQATKTLKSSFHLTIFGYRGPNTDFKARKLLLESWDQSPTYCFNHVEIIDTCDHDKLTENWRLFFPYHHSIIFDGFWDSSIARWPRRTSEWKHMASLQGVPSYDIQPPRTENLPSLQQWFAELAKPESLESTQPKIQQSAGPSGLPPVGQL